VDKPLSLRVGEVDGTVVAFPGLAERGLGAALVKKSSVFPVNYLLISRIFLTLAAQYISKNKYGIIR